METIGMSRPPAITEEVLQKLEHAFALGCTDEEACLYADISPRSLYYYQEENADFVERKEQLKQFPVLKARKSVVEALEKDPELSLKYLERKKRDEFAVRTEATGKDGGAQEVKISGEVGLNPSEAYHRLLNGGV